MGVGSVQDAEQVSAISDVVEHRLFPSLMMAPVLRTKNANKE